MLGNRIRDLRKLKNMNQRDLGKLLGVSASTIGMYEQGRREPDAESLVRLSEYFGVSVDYLLGRSLDENKKPPQTEEEIKQALFGGAEVTDEMWQKLLSFANYLKQEHEKKD